MQNDIIYCLEIHKYIIFKKTEIHDYFGEVSSFGELFREFQL